MLVGITLVGISVLMIGDSHLVNSSNLAGPLNDMFLDDGEKVYSLGICGSHAADWIKVTKGTCGGAERRGRGKVTLIGSHAATVPIKQLVAQEKPDLLVVVLGDTIASYDKSTFSRAYAWKNVTTLTKEIKDTGVRCVWVGPAWGAEGGKYGKTYSRVAEVSRFLSSNVAPCEYIDSLQFSKPGQWATLDGQHFTSNGYKEWASKIHEQIKKNP
jgi:hypothetical protein